MERSMERTKIQLALERKAGLMVVGFRVSCSSIFIMMKYTLPNEVVLELILRSRGSRRVAAVTSLEILLAQ